MKGTINILDHNGDTTLEWGTEVEDRKKNGEQDSSLSPEFVKAEFDRLVSEGHLAFVTDPATMESEQIKTFDPKAHGRVTLSPQFVGG